MDKLTQQHLTAFMGTYKSLVLVDGQYGSTGKGLIASKLASMHPRPVVTSNAGPNSGHTFYHNGEKHVLMQLPTYGVKQHLMNYRCTIYLNSGAVIDLARLIEEVRRYPGIEVYVSPYAAVAKPQEEHALKTEIGSTGKGTGSGIANKVMRRPNAVAKAYEATLEEAGIGLGERTMKGNVFVEVSQGYSLGLDAGFYPYCTSRNCTVAQAMSDAKLHPSDYGGCIMTLRTYPIRVGGNSGPGYQDQEEITWDDLEVEPEVTTVTGKQRRVFTWSRTQFFDACVANRPDVLFLNFANYLPDEGAINSFVSDNLNEPYKRFFGKEPKAILIGMGPHDDDVYIWDGAPF